MTSFTVSIRSAFQASAPAEQQRLVDLAFGSMDQRVGNAIGNGRRVAFVETAVAGTVWDLLPCFHPPDKCVTDRPSRHAYRAFDNHNITFFRIYIGFLISGCLHHTLRSLQIWWLPVWHPPPEKMHDLPLLCRRCRLQALWGCAEAYRSSYPFTTARIFVTSSSYFF